MIVNIQPSGGNDQPAIQAAIDRLRGTWAGGIVQLLGPCNIASPINLAGNGYRVTLKGAGVGTRLRPLANMQTMIDITGSMNAVEAMTVGDPTVPYSVDCGIMGLQNATQTGNKVILRDLDIDGKWNFAGIYICGIASSRGDNLAVWNRASHYAAVFSSDNFVGFTSAFETVNNNPGLAMSDWTFTQCEFHGDVPVGQASYGVMLRGAQSLRWFGGNVSASGNAYVELSSDAGGRYCHSLNFEGTTFYSENGVNPAYVFAASAPGTHYVSHKGIDAAYSTGFSTGPVTFF